MAQVLETERLILREFILTDTAFLIELLNSPGWLEYIGDRNVKTEEQATNYLINGPIKSYKENGYGLCLVEKKEDANPMGMCGIIKRETLENPDIGFAFLPEYNGQGYAYEMATATLSYANNVLKLPVISAITVAKNARSVSLLEKLGLTFKKLIQLQGSNDELLLFESDLK